MRNRAGSSIRRAFLYALFIKGACGVPLVLTERVSTKEVGFVLFRHHFTFEGEDRWERCAKSLSEVWKLLLVTNLRN